MDLELDPHDDTQASAREALSLHAAAIAWRGGGWVLCGESGAGKTGALLACMARGAAYLAADRVVVSPDGRMLCGRIEPVRVRAWHARQLELARRALDAPTRGRFAVFGVPGAVFETLPAAVRQSPPLRALGRFLRRFDRRLFADVEPAALGGTLEPAPSAPFTGLLWLERSTARQPRAARLDPGRAAANIAPEIEPDATTHRYPANGRDSGALERLLLETLRGKRILRVEHAHGASLADLADTILASMEEA